MLLALHELRRMDGDKRMTDLHACTPCFYDDESPIEMLKASCERQDIKLHPYGMGIRWINNWTCKVPRLLEYLDTVKEPFVLLVDGADTLMLRSEQDIMSLADEKYVLIASEKDPYPKALKSLNFPSTWNKLGYDYPNSGCILGPTSKLQDCLEDILQHVGELVDGNSDQEGWSRAYLRRDDIELDYYCDLCQTMSGEAYLDVSELFGRMFNNETETFPCVGHWNGRTKGRDKWYELLMTPGGTPAA